MYCGRGTKYPGCIIRFPWLIVQSPGGFIDHTWQVYRIFREYPGIRSLIPELIPENGPRRRAHARASYRVYRSYIVYVHMYFEL